jgi:hypothetical protein
MAISVPISLISVSIAWSSYLLWTKIQLSSAVSKAGCSMPVKYKHLDPFYGLDLFIKKVKHTTTGSLLAVDDEVFAKYGKTVHTLFFGKNH